MKQAEVLTQPGSWDDSQCYELDFWLNHWEYRRLDRSVLVSKIRHGDGRWFLKSFGFPETSEHSFEGFQGTVLEVGCGPIGFFEAMKNVTVKAIDPLMRKYSDHLPFSKFGRHGNCEYTNERVEDVKERFDFVVCSNVLDHTADWQDMVRHCISRLNPGGQFLLFTHSRSKPAVGHTQVFSPGELVDEFLRFRATNVKQMKVVPDLTGHGDFECYANVARES
jgi:2-polyprenyl-3-methyl-5-hydroxy-6-metoxy-1,4-benzoquinol methylase